MSMIGHFLAVSEEQLDSLIQHPDDIIDTLFPDGGESLPERHLDIDKAWHGIHFLLTGSAWDGEAPWSWAVLGGTPFGPDLGYGPARYLRADQVQDVAHALSGLAREELANRFSPEAMDRAEIYPQIYDRDGTHVLEYLLRNYDEVVKHYQGAAAKNYAMLLYLT
jgi:hypothetical protein